MVGQKKEDLPNAIALNSVMVNGARLAGAFCVDILISHFGEGVCFLFNALSFLAILVALLLMNVPDTRTTIKTRPLRLLKEGYR